jgi:glycosyltransferase involved in cell wall biosynthesis/predicted SAM-dependent methyltransferase
MQRILLNIGNTKKKLDGFINIDSNKGADIRISATLGLPFTNNSVQGIYCENFIEKITQAEAVQFLRECRRILVPEGQLKINTVNLDVIIEKYKIQNNKLHKTKHNKYTQENASSFINRLLRNQGNQWLYNEEELVRLARTAGLNTLTEIGEVKNVFQQFASLDTPDKSMLITNFVKYRPKSDKDLPLVSILITAYKSTFFRESLESALHQTYPNFEVIVCDDSSENEIRKIIDEYVPKDKRIRYIKNKTNMGGRKNYIQAFKLAKGEFIKYLNDDDRLHPECVERMAFYLNNFPEVTLITSHRQLINSAGEFLPEQFYNKRPVEVDSYIDGVSLGNHMLDKMINFIGEPTTTMFRREDLEDTRPDIFSFGGRPALANGDVTIWMNLLSKGDAIYLVDSLSYFRQHEKQKQREEGFAEKGKKAWHQIQYDGKRMGFLPSPVLPNLITKPLEQIHPNLDGVLPQINRAAVYIDQNDFFNAINELEMAIKKVPTSPELLVTLGNVFYQIGNLKEAFDKYSQSISLDTKFIPALIGRAKTNIQLGKEVDAEIDLHAILLNDPKNIDALYMTGNIYYERDCFEQAIDAFTKIYTHFPNDLEVLLKTKG